MQSRNPVLSRLGQNNRRSGGAGPNVSPQYLQDMYNAPSYAPPVAARPMTIDDVVVRGFITLGTLVVSAAVAWYFNFGWGIAAPAILVGFVLGLIVSFRQSTNPALILGYSLAYGIGIGVISKMYNEASEGIVFQAVLGTMVAFAGVLAVYALKVFRPTPKFTKFVVAAGFAAVGLMLLNWIVSIFTDGGLGLRGDSPIGWIFSVAMILLGCFFLLLDFDEIDRGVRAGVPEKYSWLMAFSLTLSLVWLYLEILRFISYFFNND
ncbi:membrane protein [Sphaerisporangium siamense]|uniref:Putative YccA/Bax inhibitor family protein n=1 Tax=Sphaerisporangium siamense TaxID=795645 RepID=A0A7W7D5T8_9ACTN|nr:Bax inhibitor-1/YccA family protein [Sphaerisporangium siamense]MBB4700783.1 putative YccA/Bax inhibitor family protein [Sphaerisporangium siamense]GII88836.1 membrane protein [Sphaerisporangium siamense]